jgi:hypothetical protein
MYILRVCKHYGLSTHQLDLLFNSLIVSLFTFAAKVWGGASYNKYISQIDKFVNRAYRNGYTGCIKKKVIELQRAIICELLGV